MPMPLSEQLARRKAIAQEPDIEKQAAMTDQLSDDIAKYDVAKSSGTK